MVWYALITALFRCPSSIQDVSDKSPKICKPYLDARSYLAPYVEPYYHEYASPYVEKVRPYTDEFNTRVYTPSLEFGKQSYQKYAAPKVDQARVASQEQWDQLVKPQITLAQSQAKQQYDTKLAPHVNKASAAAAPYYTSGRDSVTQIYNNRLLPAYKHSLPYAEKVYLEAHDIIVKTGLPYAQTAWTTTAVFFDRTLWPRIRILYGENVEPQLVRIGERLGRYRDSKKLKAVMESDDTSSSALSTASASASSFTDSVASEAITSISGTAASQEATASPSHNAEEEGEQLRERIENDLKNWQDRFAKAADKGIEDLEDRVKEITDRQIDSQVHGVGNALVIQLEETAHSETAKLKKEILVLVKQSQATSNEDEPEKVFHSLSQQTRSAGMAVKEKAQALRSWKENYDRETQSLVSAASASTLDVIDSIRDLGLQEIGLRWAQMEGVTYKDWSKYHEVKKTFDEWRSKIQNVAQEHGGLQKSREAAEEIESRGMAFAEETAKELARLKEVGQWKLEAGDLSDDFATKYMPAKTFAGAQQAMKEAEAASEQILGSSQGTVESAVSEATQKISHAASGASSAVVGDEPTVTDEIASTLADASATASEKASGAKEQILDAGAAIKESIPSQASENAGSAVSKATESLGTDSPSLSDSVSSGGSSLASEASPIAQKVPKKVYGGAMAQEVKEQKPILDDVVTDDDDATYSEKLQDMVNQAGEKYADVTKAVSDALMKATTTQGTVESASSVAEEQYSKALAAASSVLYGTKQGTAESVTSAAADKYSQAVSA